MSDLTVPYDLNAERAVLGSILLERDAIVAVSDLLHPADFYLEKHALVYQAMLACLGRRRPPDLATVAAELRQQEQLDLVGGEAFLGHVAAQVPTAVHVIYYAEIVTQAATRRRLIEAGGRIAALGYDQREELDESLDQAEQTLFAVSQRQRGADFAPMSTIVQRYFEHSQRDEDEQVIPTGILDLDQRLGGGLRPGQLALLAARPSVGKSAMALTIAYELAVRRGRSVGIVSLEMTEQELTNRFVAIHTGINTQQIGERLRRGDERITDALGVLSDAPIAVDDSSMVKVADVRSKARRLATARPLDLLIVDYLQLLIGDTNSVNRVDEVSRISRQLKLLARELRCPILALSQLSRDIEKRGGAKLPMLSDLRDSGSLEQDSDIVLFIHREVAEDDPRGYTGAVELHLSKQRNGPLGVIPVRYDPESTRFLNVSSYEAPAGY